MPTSPLRTSWPYLSTPIGVYLLVMLPICALEVFLLLTDCPPWMKWSAGGVVALSAVGLVRGYGRRLILAPEAAVFRGLFRSHRIPWSRVRRFGVYLPGGGVGATEYLFITTNDRPPRGKWDVDDETIQVQNRPGLLEAVREFRGNP